MFREITRCNAKFHDIYFFSMTPLCFRTNLSRRYNIFVFPQPQETENNQEMLLCLQVRESLLSAVRILCRLCMTIAGRRLSWQKKTKCKTYMYVRCVQRRSSSNCHWDTINIMFSKRTYRELLPRIWYTIILLHRTTIIHCSKYLRDQIFKAMHLEIYWENPYRLQSCLVELFFLILHLWQKKTQQNFICFT